MAIGRKTGGRQKGTPNKATGTQRDFIRGVIDEMQPNIMRDIKMLDPKDRLGIYLKLTEFVLPKLSAVDMNIAAPQIQSIEDTLKKLAEENE